MSRSAFRRTVVVLSLASFCVAASPGAAVAGTPPSSVPLVERAEKRLLLLEVVVEGRGGLPLCGLKTTDFSAELDLRPWPVETVDDDCPCRSTSDPARDRSDAAGGSGVAAKIRAGVVPAESSTDATSLSSAPDPRRVRRFVIYLDFSQLSQPGFVRAIDAASRWVRDRIGPDDEAMVVAYSSANGLRELSGLTRDRERLLATIERLRQDSGWVDSFAMERFSRLRTCSDPKRSALEDCDIIAFEEKGHQGAAMAALKAFLATLVGVPGRKTVLYFHENGVLFPARLYGLCASRQWKVGNLASEIEALGAAGTAARAAVYTLYAGPFTETGMDYAVNFSANVSDSTGGEYNRSSVDLDAMLARAGREQCRYLLGLRPLAPEDHKTHQVRVAARGRALPHLYRVRQLTDEERWDAAVERALISEAAWGELPVAAEMLPLSRSGDRWTVEVVVAMDGDQVSTPPESPTSAPRWRAGLALTRASDQTTWRFESAEEGQDPGKTRRIYRGRLELPAGTYKLAAYGGDRWSAELGGVGLTRELPGSGSAGAVGPVLGRTWTDVLVAGLRTHGNPHKPGEPTVEQTAWSPLIRGSAAAGDAIEARTIICGRTAPDRSSLQRFLRRAGGAETGVDDGVVGTWDTCLAVTDRIEMPTLGPGENSVDYVVRWRNPADGASQEATATVRLAASRPTDAAALPLSRRATR